MNRDRDLYYLIANPLKINREKIKKEKYIDKTLLNIIKKQYPHYQIDDNDYDIILKDIENILYNLSIKNITNKLVNDVINEIL